MKNVFLFFPACTPLRIEVHAWKKKKKLLFSCIHSALKCNTCVLNVNDSCSCMYFTYKRSTYVKNNQALKFKVLHWNLICFANLFLFAHWIFIIHFSFLFEQKKKFFYNIILFMLQKIYIHIFFFLKNLKFKIIWIKRKKIIISQLRKKKIQ